MVLQKEDKTNLNISGLKEPVQLYIPQHPGDRASPDAVRRKTAQYFVKPSYDLNDTSLISYHKINLTHDRDVVFVQIIPEISTFTPLLRIYVSYSDFPTPIFHHFSTMIPRCENVENKMVEVNCTKDPKKYVFSFTASNTGHVGPHYIGIHYYVQRTYDVGNDDATAKARIKRSCGDGSRRKKRSCVDVKSPPLPPTSTSIAVQALYNASTDLKYNLSVNIGSCLYWSEDKEEWTDEGCNVRLIFTCHFYCYVCLCVHDVRLGLTLSLVHIMLSSMCPNLHALWRERPLKFIRTVELAI